MTRSIADALGELKYLSISFLKFPLFSNSSCVFRNHALSIVLMAALSISPLYPHQLQ
jgi:hypothetical protein